MRYLVNWLGMLIITDDMGDVDATRSRGDFVTRIITKEDIDNIIGSCSSSDDYYIALEKLKENLE